jgi:hypothetical protein
MRSTIGVGVACVSLLLGSEARAQPSTSEPLAKDVSMLMQQRKLDNLAAREIDSTDRFVAALYFPTQLLVVSARYATPSLLNEQLLNRDYRNIYLQLQGAGDPKDKLFVHDVGADGLHATPSEDRPLDIIYESVTTRLVFDGDWAKQGLSEQKYRERVAAADRRYARLLEALLTQAKADSTRN